MKNLSEREFIECNFWKGDLLILPKSWYECDDWVFKFNRCYLGDVEVDIFENGELKDTTILSSKYFISKVMELTPSKY